MWKRSHISLTTRHAELRLSSQHQFVEMLSLPGPIIRYVRPLSALSLLQHLNGCQSSQSASLTFQASTSSFLTIKVCQHTSKYHLHSLLPGKVIVHPCYLWLFLTSAWSSFDPVSFPSSCTGIVAGRTPVAIIFRSYMPATAIAGELYGPA